MKGDEKKRVYQLGATLLLLIVVLSVVLFISIEVMRGENAVYTVAIIGGLILAAIVIFIFFLRGVIYVVRQKRRHTAELQRLAYYDELCQCPNLTKFKLDAESFVKLHPNDNMLMVKLDIVEFRLLNKILGRKAGDQVLIRVADALRQVADSGCFCRAHDDEFYALFAAHGSNGLNDSQNNILNRAYALLGADFQYRFQIAAGFYFMSLENCKAVTEGIEKANMAHRKAKELGQEICIYDDEMVRHALEKKQMESQMEQAMETGEFKVYLQAQHTLSSGMVSSAEALVRWETTNGELLTPNSFIPLFEENGFIIKLDFYLLDKVCAALREWLDAGMTPVEVSVNFSRNHLANKNFVQSICEVADHYKIPHHLLTVELTETLICDNEKVLLDMADLLHNKGFRLSMDDFGTGYSSLSLLKNLPVDILKIDRSFFTDNHNHTRAMQLIASVMIMAKKMDMLTIAEGVEKKEQIEFLRDSGCDKVQSYFFERPVPIEKWHERGRALPDNRLPNKDTLIQKKEM